MNTRTITLILMMLYFMSCGNIAESYKSKETKDSETKNKIDAEHYADSMVKYQMSIGMYLDTAGSNECPVKITVTPINENIYENNRISCFNNSSKKVAGIRVKCFAKDIWGEPYNFGSNKLGFNQIEVNQEIIPNSYYKFNWYIPNSKNRGKLIVWVSEIVFDDGSKWKGKTVI